MERLWEDTGGVLEKQGTVAGEADGRMSGKMPDRAGGTPALPEDMGFPEVLRETDRRMLDCTGKRLLCHTPGLA